MPSMEPTPAIMQLERRMFYFRNIFLRQGTDSICPGVSFCIARNMKKPFQSMWPASIWQRTLHRTESFNAQDA